MRINGVHHVALSVPSLDAARAFYEGCLGLTAAMDYSWRGSAGMDTLLGHAGSAGRMMFLRAGNLLLELYEYESPPQPSGSSGEPAIQRHGWTHIALDVDDARAAYKELSAKGVRFLSEPVESEFVCTVYGRDPFGNLLEFQELRGDQVPTTIQK